MESEYLDDEELIALYNKVRTGRRSWPAGLWASPAALHFAATIFDYWIHNVMGWKGWAEAKPRITPALLEQHRLADIVDSVFIPEFGSDWLEFEVVLNESMRLSEDPEWASDLSDQQERVEAAFDTAFERLIGSPKNANHLNKYHQFRNHLLRMWGAFQEAQAEHEKAQREEAEAFWKDLRLVRTVRGRSTEVWTIQNADDRRVGEVSVSWGQPQTHCLVVLHEVLPEGSHEQVIWRLEQEILVDELGEVNYSVWHVRYLGDFYRCNDCGELHSQFDDPTSELDLEILDDDD